MKYTEIFQTLSRYQKLQHPTGYHVHALSATLTTGAKKISRTAIDDMLKSSSFLMIFGQVTIYEMTQ